MVGFPCCVDARVSIVFGGQLRGSRRAAALKRVCAARNVRHGRCDAARSEQRHRAVARGRADIKRKVRARWVKDGNGSILGRRKGRAARGPPEVRRGEPNRSASFLLPALSFVLHVWSFVVRMILSVVRAGHCSRHTPCAVPHTECAGYKWLIPPASCASDPSIPHGPLWENCRAARAQAIRRTSKVYLQFAKRLMTIPGSPVGQTFLSAGFWQTGMSAPRGPLLLCWPILRGFRTRASLLPAQSGFPRGIILEAEYNCPHRPVKKIDDFHGDQFLGTAGRMAACGHRPLG